MPSDPKPRYTLLPDPDRSLYAAWGIGQLGWTGMINSGVMSALKALKESDGIDLTETGKGSYRWQVCTWSSFFSLYLFAPLPPFFYTSTSVSLLHAEPTSPAASFTRYNQHTQRLQ